MHGNAQRWLLPRRLVGPMIALASYASTGYAAPIQVTVNPGAGRHPISPLIYGVSFGDAARAGQIHWPLRRWGGNTMTRYNWQVDAANRASDYLFFSLPEDTPDPSTLPDGSTADLFLAATRSAGGQPLLTVPLIGWTPRDRQVRWGFSVLKYGPQAENECTINPFFGCNTDAGDGIQPGGDPYNGPFITGNDPHDTSKEIDPSFITAWMAHLRARFGAASSGGVKFFALDNEPGLWNSTHRDVHPNPLTYDELWQRTQDYAAAMKAADSGIQIFGPVPWGWCEYFYSPADGCGPGPDRTAHGGLDLLDWYLQQVAAYKAAHGVRLIDYLDVHYYPQGNNIALSNDESAATSALRLRSLKSLYDPTYVDESWIGQATGQAVRLVPRLKSLIQNRVPGVKLAITEYSWGNDDGLSSALAQAEALAIFGRESVDAAARWVAPAPHSRVEDAFLLYLNYDGNGNSVAGDSVAASSSNADQVGAYAVAGAGNRLNVLLFNKSTTAQTVHLALTGGGNASAVLYRFSGAQRLGPAGTLAVAGGDATVNLPARSATLAVMDLTAPNPVPCVPGSTTLCLNGGRFKVAATFATTHGESGKANVVKLTDDTGYLWFFSASNVEAVVKVLDACALAAAPRYWVFAGGLTNVNVVLTVTDSQTGAVKTYTNPQNTPFQPLQDTDAFSTCP